MTETKEDPVLQKLISTLGLNLQKGKFNPDLAEYQHVYPELSVSADGVVLRGNRIVVPRNLIARVLELAHAGHQGIVKTKSLIRSKIWYPGIDKQVERKV